VREHKVMQQIRSSLGVWVLVGLVLATLGGVAIAAAGQRTVAAQDEFVPLDALPPDEQLPAAPLVLAAYAAAWLIVLVYIWSIWQRLGRVEREMQDVSRRLDERPRGAAEPR
jgi:CcmD family protein